MQTSLFSDPRPVYLSRLKISAAQSLFYSIRLFCEQKLKQFEFFKNNSHYQSRLKIVKFEEFALNPKEEAKKIYDFLKLKFPIFVENWLEENTIGSDGDNFGTSRNSTEIISKWKNEITREQKVRLDSICADYLTELQYDF